MPKADWQEATQQQTSGTFLPNATFPAKWPSGIRQGGFFNYDVDARHFCAKGRIVSLWWRGVGK
ncbi:hypothetical protein [Erythrobacter sp. QSSC1-22B]|uniref:hypothetical protein n=1 Tax=Erythrobacter sp. QSSC1-22B TaxID=1860125 RepID=UPI00119D1C6D|nr:hypothetical protein [Erythrobacter sp. QSSC1-22B]